MIRIESPLRNLRVAAALAGALAVAVFLNSLANEFAYDDHHIILENQPIQSLETLPGALTAPYWPGRRGPGLGLWRPAITALFGVQWALWGDNPLGYHAVNVLLHGAVTVLVVLLLGELIPFAGAFVAGLVFAVHSVHVEAVANVVGVAEILAAFFFLWACLLILRGGERMSVGRHLAVLLLFALGFLTKESAVTLPAVVLLLDSSRRELGLSDLPGYLRRRWPLYGGMAVVVGLILLVRQAVLGTVAKPFAPLGAHLLDEIPRIWTVAASWPHVTRILFFPADLVADYGPDVIPVALGWGLDNGLGVVMVLAVLSLALLSWRRGVLAPGALSSRALAWGVVWFVITVSPTSNLLFLSGIILSERTLYLPSVGFVIAVGWVALRLHRARPRIAVLLLATSILLLGYRSWTRTPSWKNNMAVVTTLVVEHPESGRAQWLLGDTHWGEGRRPEALRAYRAAVTTLDNHYVLLTETGYRFMAGGLDRAAELLLTTAWRDNPEFRRAPGLLSALYERRGRFADAEAAARASLAIDSTQVVQHHLLSRALRGQDRLVEAAEARRTVIRLGEAHRWQQWAWLAQLQMEMGDTSEARGSLDSAWARGASVPAVRQIDSLLIPLSPVADSAVEMPLAGPESARDLQNPRPGDAGRD